MKVVLFEDQQFQNLLPLVYFRPAWELRCGALTLREKLVRRLKADCRYQCRDYLNDHLISPDLRAESLDPRESVLLLNGRALVAEGSADLLDLSTGEAIVDAQTLVATRLPAGEIARFCKDGIWQHDDYFAAAEATTRELSAEDPLNLIDYLWEAVHLNGQEIVNDFHLVAQAGERSGTCYDGVQIVAPEQVSIAAGAVIKSNVVIDADNGPVWIDSDATIMAGAVIEGPVYVGKESTIKAAAKIYPQTTIGPVCKVGGEVEDSIILGYSNKQHDGFLGHAYLGAWVNLGADTNNSDLKNNYGNVQVPVNGRMVNSGERFVGLMMGDHSKCAINTMFNTGTVVGVSANIFGAGMPPKFMPSFTWGGAENRQLYNFDKAVEVARVVVQRRNVPFTTDDLAIFEAVRTLAKQVEAGSPL